MEWEILRKSGQGCLMDVAVGFSTAHKMVVQCLFVFVLFSILLCRQNAIQNGGIEIRLNAQLTIDLKLVS